VREVQEGQAVKEVMVVTGPAFATVEALEPTAELARWEPRVTQDHQRLPLVTP